jgi:hypothetical protein
MKQIFIRLFFALIILGINLLIITPQVPIFSNYEIDLRVLIPFLGLLFLDPFISLFNPFFCSIKQLKKINNENESIIIHQIEYRGKDSLNVTVEIHSTSYDIECTKGELNEMFIPENTRILITREKPTEILTFKLKQKESILEMVTEKKATIKYKKNYLTQKINIE